jgi:hypothetical protein
MNEEEVKTEETALLWPDPETEYIEAPIKVPIPDLAEKWHLRDPNYPTNTHKLNTYTTLLRTKSVKRNWVSRRKAYQKKLERIKELAPKQQLILDKAEMINQKHFKALGQALRVYEQQFSHYLDDPLTITPKALKQLTAAMLDIQKGQRLATGMVTDRVGFVSEDEVKTAFRQVASILIFVFESGGVPMEVREAAMQRLEAAIDVGGDNG